MLEYPVHVAGTRAHLPLKTIATFPVGTFLENVAVRPNGHLLVSDMIRGEIHHLDPNATDPQATVKKVHAFLPAATTTTADEYAGDYGSGMTGEAIVEDNRTADVFYTFSGQVSPSPITSEFHAPSSLPLANIEDSTARKAHGLCTD